ncbi:hypothetical protein EMGBD4_09850 [Verrucomicrobiota bacterium]|nr:hypothetical protein EMGBD4_09850 [Verrucomicrobiota bacterium]
MRARLVNGVLERITNECRGRLVWRTHVKANDIPTGRLQREHALCELGKKYGCTDCMRAASFIFYPCLWSAHVRCIQPLA